MGDVSFSARATAISGPIDRFLPVTPDDATDLSGGVTRSIFVGGAGTVVAVDRFGNRVTFVSGPSQYHPLRVARILATGSSATDIVALY